MMIHGMGWMMGEGGLLSVVVLVLVIAAGAWLALRLARSELDGMRLGQVALIALATIGALALLAVAGMALMHTGMMSGGMMGR